MQTTIQSLAWKEWHEHKWKLASIVAAVWTIAAFMLWKIRHEPDALSLIVAITASCCVLPLSMFIGVSDAAGERSRRTLPFLQSLPVSTRRVALIKLAFGIATIVLSVLLSALFVVAYIKIASVFGVDYTRSVTSLLSEGRISITGIAAVDEILLVISVGVSIYLWSAAVGVHCKDEVSAGAMAVLVMISWWLMLMLAWRILLFSSTDDSTLPIRIVGISTGPASAFSLHVRSHPVLWLGIASGVGWHALLVLHFVRRFGITAAAERFSPRGLSIPAKGMPWLPSPRATQSTAILWKQCRECAPVALVGILGTLALVAVTALINDRSFDPPRPELLLETTAITSAYFGFLIAIVMGIAVCHHDTPPKVNEFWRSRPIPVHLWFWTKFITGLLFLAIVVYAPILCALWLSGNGLNDLGRPRELFVVPLVHLAAYAAGVAMASLVRNTGYAAILSVPTAFAGLLAVYSAVSLARHIGWLGPAPDRFTPTATAETIFLFIAGSLLSFFANTLLAWLATWFDWGRKAG